MVSRSLDTAKIHSWYSIFTFCVNVDALYLYLISIEHTANNYSNRSYGDIGNHHHIYTFGLHVCGINNGSITIS